MIDRQIVKEVLKATEASGKVFFKLDGDYDRTTFFMTVAEFMELADCHIRERRRIATKISRKAPLEYPNEYAADKKQGPKAPWRLMRYGIAIMINRDGVTRWINLPLPERRKWPGISMIKRGERGNHIKYDAEKPITVLEKLKKRWMTVDAHRYGDLIGIELEFATEERTIEETVEFREGMCNAGCCPGEGPMTIRKIKRKLPKAVFRDIETLIPGVKIKSDGSVKPCYADAAEATLLAGSNGYSRLEKLTQIIRDRGAFVNKSCGIHVHLDVRGIQKREVGVRAAKLFSAIDILKDLVPDSRFTDCPCGCSPRYNHYCKIEKPSFGDDDDGFRRDRYRAINLESYRKFQTIEVRLGGGSLNPSKIWHWANLLLCLSKAKKHYADWDEFLSSDFPLYLRIWTVNRADELRKNETLRLRRMNAIAPGLDQVLKAQYDANSKIE